MYREVIYFCAELLNYWAMTFFGLKLFAKVYEIQVHKNKGVENLIFTLLCLPISWHAAGNYVYAQYSTFLSHVIVVYMYILICLIVGRREKFPFSIVGFWIYGMRLVDLLIVAIAKEISRVSRDIEFELINHGFDRVIFLVLISVSYYGIYHFCSQGVFFDYIKGNKIRRIVFCIYCLLGNMCFCIVYLDGYNGQILNYWIFYLVCAFILVGMFLFYLIGIKGKERERLLKMRNDMMEANYKGLKKAYETNKTLQHDHKNHLLAIFTLIEEDKKSDALDYIRAYLDYNRTILKDLKTGNNILDIILNCKIDEAKDNNIRFDYCIEYIGQLHIQDIDMCALMANLLDNAMEASGKSGKEEPWICFKLYRRKEMLFINLSNCFHRNKNERKTFFQTEKQNKQLHGWGMKSIEAVIKKYGGHKEYHIHDGFIEIVINIPIEKS